MRILGCAAAAAVLAFAGSAIPAGPAKAMPVDPAVSAGIDSPVQPTARKKRLRRGAGVGGAIRRDLGGPGPGGGGMGLGRGTATSPGGVPTEGRGGMGR